jgi:hypothetical protein
MKVVCISRGRKRFESQFCGGYWYDEYKNELTIGKVYETINRTIVSWGYFDNDSHFIKTDSGNDQYFNKNLFIELKEYRRRKLEKLNEI